MHGLTPGGAQAIGPFALRLVEMAFLQEVDFLFVFHILCFQK